MNGFSWKEFIIQADKNLLRQAMVLAKKGQAQTKLDHPNEVVDAQRGDFTQLKLRLKKELQTRRVAILERRERIAIGQT